MKKIISLFLTVVLVVMAIIFFSRQNAENEDEYTNSNQTENLPSSSEKKGEDVSSDEKGQNNDTPVSADETRVKFLAVGDVLIHEAIFTEAKSLASQNAANNNKNNKNNNKPDDYYFDGFYENIASKIKSADIAFVNHECPIAGNDAGVSGYPVFNAPTQSGDALVKLGFNVVNMSNNHMFDFEGKTKGYANTIDYWNSKDVLAIGGYKNQEDYDTPRILNSNGINIAFLSYTYGTNGYSMNADSAKKGYICPLIKDDDIKRQVRNAKQKADLVFVSIHWGNENTFEPSAEQHRLANMMADEGVDVIIGHHSHTVQPVEWLEGKQGHKTLCMFSLGNLISTMLNSYNMVGGLMTFDIVKNESGISIENPLMDFTVCHYVVKDRTNLDSLGYATRSGVKVYMMNEYTEELANNHGSQTWGEFTFQTLKNYAKNVVKSEFLPSYLK